MLHKGFAAFLPLLEPSSRWRFPPIDPTGSFSPSRFAGIEQCRPNPPRESLSSIPSFPKLSLPPQKKKRLSANLLRRTFGDPSPLSHCSSVVAALLAALFPPSSKESMSGASMPGTTASILNAASPRKSFPQTSQSLWNSSTVMSLSVPVASHPNGAVHEPCP